jgi:general stress protein YciG
MLMVIANLGYLCLNSLILPCIAAIRRRLEMGTPKTKGTMTVAEAGRKGGNTTYASREGANPYTRKKKKKQTKQPPMTVGEAGRLGGQATAKKHDHAHYVKIGSMGGTRVLEDYGHQFFSEIGMRGAQARAAKRKLQAQA